MGRNVGIWSSLVLRSYNSKGTVVMVQESVKPKSKHVYRTVDDLDLELYMDFPED